MTRNTWRLGRQPALDGMRGVAAVAVVAHHFFGFFTGGRLGVDVFFVLSGFLITSLLVQEAAERHDINLRTFWLRRFLRLIPAMVVLVAVVGFLARQIPGTTAGVVPTLLYFTNWQRALVRSPGALGHTWSLAIEEQFYLLWPVILTAMWKADPTLRKALRWTVLAAFAVILIRGYAIHAGVSAAMIYNASHFRADGLLIGCALALGMSRGTLPARLGRRGGVGLAMIGGAVVADQWLPLGIPMVLVGVGAALLIAAAVTGNAPRLSGWLSNRAVRWVGVRSYGLYLWHFPITRVLVQDHRSPLTILAGLGLSFLCAALSYRLVETPFLRLKDKIASKAATPELEMADQPIAA